MLTLVPGGSWLYTTNHEGSNYVGLYLTMTFSINIEAFHSKLMNVLLESPQKQVLQDGGNIDEGRVKVEVNRQTFHVNVIFSPLSSEDAGYYRCTGRVVPIVGNEFVMNGSLEREINLQVHSTC